MADSGLSLRASSGAAVNRVGGSSALSASTKPAIYFRKPVGDGSIWAWQRFTINNLELTAVIPQIRNTWQTTKESRYGTKSMLKKGDCWK
jgi:hypothetical protein